MRPVFPDTPDELSTLGEELFRAYQQLIALRRRFAWLHSARVETEDVRNGYLRYRVTATDPQLVGDDAGELGTQSSAGGGQRMPSLLVELNVEGDNTTAVVRNGANTDIVEFEYS